MTATPYLSAEASLTKGKRVAGEIKKELGVDLNTKSKDVLRGKVELNKKGGNAAGYYSGKDNKTVTSSGGAVDAEAGLSYTQKTTTQTQNNGSSSVVATSQEFTAGYSILSSPVSINGSAENSTETNNGSTTTTNTVKSYFGVGGALGDNYVVDFSLQIGIKVSFKKKDEK